MPINQQTAEEAYQAVLDHAGCSLPNRDAIDTRIFEEVRNGTAKYGDNGFVNNPSVVGGWPSLKSGEVSADSDHDGMPNRWETKKGLNPDDAADGALDPDGDGYSNLENYLNWIAAGKTLN